MRGNMVITSNEDKTVKGCMIVRKIEPAGNYILWTFSDEDAAYRAARVFMNCDFEYVKRV